MAPTLDERIERQAAWVRVRADYVDRWPRVTFTELAEEHGIPRGAIGRQAKRERWAHHARVIHAEKRKRRSEEDLAFARRQAVEIAHAIVGFARDKRITLEQLAAEASEAARGLDYVWSAAFQFADAANAAEDAKAGRPRRDTSPFRDLSHGRPVSGGKGVPGRWPWRGYGPREPWPWEKRRRVTRAA